LAPDLELQVKIEEIKSLRKKLKLDTTFIPVSEETADLLLKELREEYEASKFVKYQKIRDDKIEINNAFSSKVDPDPPRVCNYCYTTPVYGTDRYCEICKKKNKEGKIHFTKKLDDKLFGMTKCIVCGNIFTKESTNQKRCNNCIDKNLKPKEEKVKQFCVVYNKEMEAETTRKYCSDECKEKAKKMGLVQHRRTDAEKIEILKKVIDMTSDGKMTLGLALAELKISWNAYQTWKDRFEKSIIAKDLADQKFPLTSTDNIIAFVEQSSIINELENIGNCVMNRLEFLRNQKREELDKKKAEIQKQLEEIDAELKKL